MTIDELINKLDEAKVTEANAKSDWKAAEGEEKEEKFKIFESAKAARKQVQQDIEAFKFAADKVDPAPKPAPKPAPAPKTTNERADALWYLHLRRLGRRSSPRPAGWGE